METSAKDGRNVDAVFTELIRLIRKDPIIAQTIAKRRAASFGVGNVNGSSSGKRRGLCVLL